MQTLKRGWRWENGSLAYSRKWELEDESRSPLDITIAALRDTVRGILSCLSFTFESGQDYVDG